jgi:hypothetical protein
MKKVIILPLIVSLVGCSSSQIIQSLRVVVEAATAAVQFVPNAPPEVKEYLGAVNNGLSCATGELASDDSTEVKATRIVGCFASATQPVIPPGTPATIVAAVQAVSAALASFLSNYKPVGMVSAHSSSKATVPIPDQLTASDRRALGTLNKQIKSNLKVLGK